MFFANWRRFLVLVLVLVRVLVLVLVLVLLLVLVLHDGHSGVGFPQARTSPDYSRE